MSPEEPRLAPRSPEKDHPNPIPIRLLKEGGVLRTQWKRRWCVLQPEGMYYFRSESKRLPADDEPARGLIPILGASVRLLSADFHFEIATARRTYLFRVDREYHAAEQRKAYDEAEASQAGQQTLGALSSTGLLPAGVASVSGSTSSALRSGQRRSSWIGDLLPSLSASASPPEAEALPAPGSAAAATVDAEGGASSDSPARIGSGFYSTSGEAAVARAAASLDRSRRASVVVVGGESLAGSALEGESSGSYGKDLAAWMAALQRANSNMYRYRQI